MEDALPDGDLNRWMDALPEHRPARLVLYRGLHAEYDGLRSEMRAAKKLGAAMNQDLRQDLLDRIGDWDERLSSYIREFPDSDLALHFSKAQRSLGETCDVHIHTTEFSNAEGLHSDGGRAARW